MTNDLRVIFKYFIISFYNFYFYLFFIIYFSFKRIYVGTKLIFITLNETKLQFRKLQEYSNVTRI